MPHPRLSRRPNLRRHHAQTPSRQTRTSRLVRFHHPERSGTGPAISLRTNQRQRPPPMPRVPALVCTPLHQRALAQTQVQGHQTPHRLLGFRPCRREPPTPPFRPPTYTNFMSKPPQPEPPHILIYGLPIAEVSQFTYLGRILDKNDDDSPAIAARIRIAAATFGSLRKRFYANKASSTSTKLAVTKAVLQAQVVYGSPTWVVSSHDSQKLRSFQQRTLRHATAMHPTKTNGELRYPRCEAVLARAHSDDLLDTINHALMRFVGHILRSDGDSLANAHTRRMLQSSLPASFPGRQGYANCNLLKSHITDHITNLHMQLAAASDRTLWQKAIEPLLHTFTNSRQASSVPPPQPTDTPPPY